MVAGSFREIVQSTGADGGNARAPISDRVPRFLGADAPADRLRSLRLGLVGAGSVGGRTIRHCARLQPDEVWIIDPARFKSQGLLTQPIMPEDVGQPKATSLGRVCKAISPGTRVWVFDGEFQSVDASPLDAVDVMLLATDNLAAEVAVSQFCLNRRKALCQASVHGDTLVAQIRLLSNREHTGPCLGCGFGTQEWDHYYRETIFSCSGPQHVIGRSEPTMSVSFLCSLAADLAMMQLLRFVLGLGAPVTDTILEYCGYTHTTTISPLVRNPSCRCEHIPWSQVAVPDPLRDSTLSQLAAAGGFPTASRPADLSFELAGYVFVDSALCMRCGHLQRVRRFGAQGEPVGQCSRCQHGLQVQPFFGHSTVASANLVELMGATLAQLGAGDAGAVTIRSAGRAVRVFASGFPSAGCAST